MGTISSNTRTSQNVIYFDLQAILATNNFPSYINGVRQIINDFGPLSDENRIIAQGFETFKDDPIIKELDKYCTNASPVEVTVVEIGQDKEHSLIVDYKGIQGSCLYKESFFNKDDSNSIIGTKISAIVTLVNKEYGFIPFPKFSIQDQDTIHSFKHNFDNILAREIENQIPVTVRIKNIAFSNTNNSVCGYNVLHRGRTGFVMLSNIPEAMRTVAKDIGFEYYLDKKILATPYLEKGNLMFSLKEPILEELRCAEIKRERVMFDVNDYWKKDDTTIGLRLYYKGIAVLYPIGFIDYTVEQLRDFMGTKKTLFVMFNDEDVQKRKPIAYGWH